MDIKARLKTTWMSGDYDRFSRFMEAGAEEYCKTLDIQPGMRVLDVGCGSGQLALMAARRGAKVTGCDIAANWLEVARARAAAEGLPASFEEGDAEALPYPDGHFDLVTSLVGAMFAPQPDAVAAELVRVCRPGGRITMANWTPAGFIGQMFKTIAKHIAPSGMPSPVLWGDEATVRQRFGQGVSELTCTKVLYPFRYPFPPAGVVRVFREMYGPSVRAFASLDESGQAQLQGELEALWASHNQNANGLTAVDSEYLSIVATRA